MRLLNFTTVVAFSLLSFGLSGQKQISIIDNFESYSGKEELSKVWYKPGHGGENTRSLDTIYTGGGKHSLKCEYTTTNSNQSFYIAFCRVDKWNLTGSNAIRFWMKPDGSGREMTIELNISNSQGKNIHDLWDFKYQTMKGDTTGRWITIPFRDFIHNIKYADAPNVSPVFKPEALIEVAVCIGGRKDEAGSGVFYFDEFSGIRL